MFKSYSTQIKRVTISPHRTPDSKVSATIIFYNIEEPERVLKENKYINFRGEQYCLTWHQHHFNHEMRTWNLLVENFPPSWDARELDDEFSLFGNVVSAKVHKIASPKLFGWVQMED